MFDREIPYNDLPLLPPQEQIENDTDILKKLVIASRALASVNTNVLRLPNPLMLINTISLQEAKTSTEIENIFTTEDELYKAISDHRREEMTDPATKEVLRYREAIWAGYNAIREKQKIDIQLMIDIFRQIKNTNAGIRPPHALVVIKKGDSEFGSGQTIYTPPRGNGIPEKLLENLENYLNDDQTFPIDPLIKMCIGHYQFEAIHPFQDGNGRTGRVLNLLLLNHKKLLSYPVLFHSKYIILNKDEYYHRLGAVTQRQDWKNWILFMLNAIEKTSILTNELIDAIIDQMEATLVYAKTMFTWYNKDLNELIFSQPYLKQKTFSQVLAKSSRTTLTKYLAQLTESKILHQVKDGKEVYYLNNELLRILGS